jgi:hypothetical protein
LVTALVAARYGERVMGVANLGVGVWSKDPGSAFMQEKRRLRSRADPWFYVGLGLTALPSLPIGVRQ